MDRLRLKEFFGIGLMLLLLLSFRPAHADGIVPGHVLVRVQTDDDVNSLDDDYDTQPEDGISGTGLYALRTPANTDDASFAQELRQDPRVVFAEMDTYVDLPEVHGGRFHFAFDLSTDPKGYLTQTAYSQINLPGAPSATRPPHGLTQSPSVIVAVLDSGVTFRHAALRGHLLMGYNAIQPGALPYDMPDSADNTALGHGTMVAGIIARIAPQAQVMPVRVLNSGGVGTMLDVLHGLDYAITNGAQVINMSFGTTQPSEALKEALDRARRAGILLVASTGDDGAESPEYPAAYPNVLAVASVDADDTRSVFSNYGTYISVAAPGAAIRSTYWTGGYADWSGTSFAAPFVSAEAALLASANPGRSSRWLERKIRKTARNIDKLNPDCVGMLGAGVIDIQAALTPPTPSSSDDGGDGGGD